MDISFQYPPELLRLLIEAIPKLCKSKKDLMGFFQGVGVSREALKPYQQLLQTNKDAFNKYHVTREILTALNEAGESSLRERREVLKRVTLFDDFTVCWDSDQAAARGYVAQIRELVNVKDSFTRINLERENERKARLEPARRQAEDDRKKKEESEEIRRQLFALFGESNPQKRGKAVEAVLNRYFKASDILVSEAISVKGAAGDGVVEQIDGVVQMRGQLFLVEMKWEQETLGRDKVGSHLVRIFNRNLAGGIIISYSDYSPAVIQDCRDALTQKTVILCRLEEFVRAIEKRTDLKAILEQKIDAAVIHKNPLFTPEI
jgi:restriction system protein